MKCEIEDESGSYVLCRMTPENELETRILEALENILGEKGYCYRGDDGKWSVRFTI